MSDIEPQSIAPGVYRHTKSGHDYQVLGVALETETGQQLVIYRPLYEHQYELFARPYGMFVDQVEIDGQIAPRFELIGD